MLYISSSCVKNTNFIEGLKELSLITPNIELSGGSKYSKNLLLDLINMKDKNELNFLIHGFFPPSKDETFLLNLSNYSSSTRSFIEESMKYVYELEIDYYSLHGGFRHSYDIVKDDIFNKSGNFQFEDMLKSIKWFLQKFPDKKLAVENMYPVSQMLDSAFCMTLKEISKLLDIEKGVYLLLDLGHLKVSSYYLNFNFINTAEILFQRYADRILEIHLSENSGKGDEHLHISRSSEQYLFIKRNIDIIKKYNINIVIESRNASSKKILTSFMNIKEIVNEYA